MVLLCQCTGEARIGGNPCQRDKLGWLYQVWDAFALGAPAPEFVAAAAAPSIEALDLVPAAAQRDLAP
jgi:hypothetical protein